MKWLLCLFALASGCASYESTARSEFVHQATCPADRVTIAHPAPEAAPPEIASDPGRLAVWNADAERRAKSRFVATGCGQVRRYECTTLYVGEGRDQASFPSCTPL